MAGKPSATCAPAEPPKIIVANCREARGRKTPRPCLSQS
jgi:hypothetical protein